jgi:23S rRNA (uracil1939-C5)-methyltransferase
MNRRRRRKLPKDPIEVTIDDLSHDGRGVASWGEKKVFIHGALPGERVLARITDRKRSYDEGETLEVLDASKHRIEPQCPNFGQCGGCSLQHLEVSRQIESKQNTLLQNLERIGKVVPLETWKPLTGPSWHYRRKARLSVRYVHKKERVLVGFRERYGRFVADMQECHVLDLRIAEQLSALSQLIHSMDARSSIPQLEVACGDESCALIFRHMEPLSESDQEKLRGFARQTGIAVLLQPKGPATIHCLEPESLDLSFNLPDYGINMVFEPSDFVQVNAEMNQIMISRVMELLDPGADDRVLDLFCGLGNFTLPIATRADEVVGIEGETGLVSRALANATRNKLSNAQFFAADLNLDPTAAPWLRKPYNKVLVDPPRSGAEFILPHIAASGADRLVYVSCHPASLARDAGILVHQFGFRLMGAGVMDMFPHTGHVESIALFERNSLSD